MFMLYNISNYEINKYIRKEKILCSGGKKHGKKN